MPRPRRGARSSTPPACAACSLARQRLRRARRDARPAPQQHGRAPAAPPGRREQPVRAVGRRRGRRLAVQTRTPVQTRTRAPALAHDAVGHAVDGEHERHVVAGQPERRRQDQRTGEGARATVERDEPALVSARHDVVRPIWRRAADRRRRCRRRVRLSVGHAVVGVPVVPASDEGARHRAAAARSRRRRRCSDARSRPTTTGSWSLERRSSAAYSGRAVRLPLEGGLARRVADGVVVVEQRHLVGVDVPLGDAGDLGRERRRRRGRGRGSRAGRRTGSCRRRRRRTRRSGRCSPAPTSVVIGSSRRYELRSPRMMTSRSQPPVDERRRGGRRAPRRPRCG